MSTKPIHKMSLGTYIIPCGATAHNVLVDGHGASIYEDQVTCSACLKIINPPFYGPWQEGIAMAKDSYGRWHRAILTNDGRARVDYGDLEDLTLYEIEWVVKDKTFIPFGLITNRQLDWT